MSFYAYKRPQMGFVWLAPVVQLVGGALQSHPVSSVPLQTEQSSQTVSILLAVGGVAVLGGLAYMVIKS